MAKLASSLQGFGKRKQQGGAPTIEDNFSTYLYTGNGATQNIVNGIDLATDGGMVWTKSRSGAFDHRLYDTERSLLALTPNSTLGEESDTDEVTGFNTDGYSIGADGQFNNSSYTYASWTFKKAPRFFDMVKYTGDGVAGREIAHNLGCDIGWIIIKNITSGTANWTVWNRTTPDGYTMSLDLTGGDYLTNCFASNASQTDTVFKVGTSNLLYTNNNGDTYIAYLFAHDPLGASGDGSDGMIACGSYTGNHTTKPSIDLGWEPQYVMIKNADAISGWFILDTMRAFSYTSSGELYANDNLAETTPYADFITPTANGFDILNLGSLNDSGNTYIYMPIRRPMKTPTSSSEVFAIDTSGSTNPSPPRFSSGFTTDAALWNFKSGSNHSMSSRLTGIGYLNTNETAAEITNDPSWLWDYMDGYYDGSFVSTDQFSYMFKRATGFFDVVCYTGDGIAGRTVNHNLGVVPEMIWLKKRNTVSSWYVYNADTPVANTMFLEQATADADNAPYFNDTVPTSSGFQVDSHGNWSSDTYIAYLFATLDGISKVGTYTGNGTSQTIDCGFTTGAKFVIIKRTDSAGDWMMWDSVRGIVAGTEGFLELNTTNAEDATLDLIDPDNSGFIINQEAVHNLNVATTGQYIYYAIAN